MHSVLKVPLRQYRRRGVAKALICDVLRRMDADFATVSGDRENASKPEELYRSCGFTGKDVWHILPSNRLTINAEDITLSSQEQSGYCTYTAENKSGKVTYRYTADKDGLLCFHIEQSKRNNLAVYVNGSSYGSVQLS